VSSLSELVTLAENGRAACPGERPYLLGIVGPPGSGKSTLTEALSGALPTWAVVQMDGFHLSNEVLMTLHRRDRKGAPDTFDVDGFASLLSRIRERRHVVYGPRFRRDLEEPIAASLAVPTDAPGIIVEGNYLLHEGDGWGQVAPLLDDVWYVDTPADICYARLVARATLTYGPVDGPRWVHTVDEPNAALVRQTAAHATHLVTLTR
jgi:pantothenate kinase